MAYVGCDYTWAKFISFLAPPSVNNHWILWSCSYRFKKFMLEDVQKNKREGWKLISISTSQLQAAWSNHSKLKEDQIGGESSCCHHLSLNTGHQIYFLAYESNFIHDISYLQMLRIKFNFIKMQDLKKRTKDMWHFFYPTVYLIGFFFINYLRKLQFLKLRAHISPAILLNEFSKTIFF